jgi:FixJ family two-component response regulator
MNAPTVFIVDDDKGVRNSIRELMISVGIAAETFESAVSFLDAFDTHRPGCLVLDVRMARMSGLALQEKLEAIGARLPIVFVSGHGDIDMAVNVIKKGAVSFVQKPYRAQQLLDAVREALQRDAAQRVVAGGAGELADRLRLLTAREREIMDLALKGHTNKVIAQDLGISYRTVEVHRSRLLEKLGVTSVTEFLRLISHPGG